MLLYSQATEARALVSSMLKLSVPTIVRKLTHLPEAVVIEAYDELKCAQYDVERAYAYA
jgi:hypothetical protein